MKFSIFFLLLVSYTGFSQRAMFLIAGQSNAVGQGDKAASLEFNSGSAFEYKLSLDSLVPLSDPVGETFGKFERANTGSIAPAFAKKYNELSGKKVIIISAARGGSSINIKAELSNMGTWDEKGKLLLFDDAVDKATRVTRKTGSSLNGIIWLQGERDANAINAGQLTVEEYRNSLVSVVNRFRAGIGSEVSFYIVLTGYYRNHSHDGFDAVRSVQQEVSKRLKNVYIVFKDTDQFEEKKLMKDDIHYNQEGLNKIGTVVAEEVFGHEKTNRK